MKVISNRALQKRDEKNLMKGAVIGSVAIWAVKKYVLPHLRSLSVKVTPQVTATFDGPAARQ